MALDLLSGTSVIAWNTDDLPDYSSPARPGAHAKEREFEDRGRGIRFRVVTGGKRHEEISGEKAVPFFSPRHRHTFDQLRYYHKGHIKYGDKLYESGDLLYIPGGSFYGPMTYPEQHEDGADGYRPSSMLMQFEGSSGIPYYSATEFAEAKERLLKKGSFEAGIYVPDEGRRQDGWEALLEEHTGQPVVYPESALKDYVVVRTSKLPWRPVEGQPGVEAKYAAHFTEAGPNVTIVKMKAGSKTPAGFSGPNQQLRGLFEGRVRFGEEPGVDYVPVSCRYIPPESDFAETECLEDAVMIVVKWAPDGHLYLPDPAI